MLTQFHTDVGWMDTQIELRTTGGGCNMQNDNGEVGVIDSQTGVNMEEPREHILLDDGSDGESNSDDEHDCVILDSSSNCDDDTVNIETHDEETINIDQNVAPAVTSCGGAVTLSCNENANFELSDSSRLEDQASRHHIPSDCGQVLPGLQVLPISALETPVIHSGNANSSGFVETNQVQNNSVNRTPDDNGILLLTDSGTSSHKPDISDHMEFFNSSVCGLSATELSDMNRKSSEHRKKPLQSAVCDAVAPLVLNFKPHQQETSCGQPEAKRETETYATDQWIGGSEVDVKYQPNDGEEENLLDFNSQLISTTQLDHRYSTAAVSDVEATRQSFDGNNYWNYYGTDGDYDNTLSYSAETNGLPNKDYENSWDHHELQGCPAPVVTVNDGPETGLVSSDDDCGDDCLTDEPSITIHYKADDLSFSVNPSVVIHFKKKTGDHCEYHDDDKHLLTSQVGENNNCHSEYSETCQSSSQVHHQFGITRGDCHPVTNLCTVPIQQPTLGYQVPHTLRGQPQVDFSAIHNTSAGICAKMEDSSDDIVEVPVVTTTQAYTGPEQSSLLGNYVQMNGQMMFQYQPDWHPPNESTRLKASPEPTMLVPSSGGELPQPNAISVPYGTMTSQSNTLIPPTEPVSMESSTTSTTYAGLPHEGTMFLTSTGAAPPKMTTVITIPAEPTRVMEQTESDTPEPTRLMEQTENVPVEPTSIIAQIGDVPTEPTRLVAQTEGVPAEATRLMAQTEGVPAKATRLMAQTEGVSYEPNMLSTQTEGLPHNPSLLMALPESVISKQTTSISPIGALALKQTSNIGYGEAELEHKSAEEIRSAENYDKQGCLYTLNGMNENNAVDGESQDIEDRYSQGLSSGENSNSMSYCEDQSQATHNNFREFVIHGNKRLSQSNNDICKEFVIQKSNEQPQSTQNNFRQFVIQGNQEHAQSWNNGTNKIVNENPQSWNNSNQGIATENPQSWNKNNNGAIFGDSNVNPHSWNDHDKTRELDYQGSQENGSFYFRSSLSQNDSYNSNDDVQQQYKENPMVYNSWQQHARNTYGWQSVPDNGCSEGQQTWSTTPNVQETQVSGNIL